MADAFTTPPADPGGDTLTGPARRPRQMLADQEYDGHASVHDGDMAERLGLAGAPIEGPTHFSQFDPLAYSWWGRRWFETGCISAHFTTMVVDGESVTATATRDGDTASIRATKPGADGSDDATVLTGTMTVDPQAPTELSARLEAARERDPGELFVIDRVVVGERRRVEGTVSVDASTPNGPLYPFSLRQKLDAITEPSDWYTSDDTPWGRPILPFEMYSVLANKAGSPLPVRGPAVGLFLDLEVRAVDGPLLVGEEYVLEREVLAVGQSRKVESHWVETTITRASDSRHVATVLLHSGVFKASFADYPADRL